MVGAAYEAQRFASVRSRGTRISPCRQRIRPALRAARTHIKVLTASREYLISMPLRQLLRQLDPDQFWQVRRATVVRADVIATAYHAVPIIRRLQSEGATDEFWQHVWAELYHQGDVGEATYALVPYWLTTNPDSGISTSNSSISACS
jgi:hypothetical protein